MPKTIGLSILNRTTIMSTQEGNRKSGELALLILLALASFDIISQSYLGTNGMHSWRQADVLSQIYGFLHFKGISPLHNFLGLKTIYDIPIYEFMIAKLSIVFNADPLVVTRYVNLGFWLLLAAYGYKLCELLAARAGLLFIFLITTSPLFLHYYAVPLPDTAAISLSMIAITLMIQNESLVIHIASGILLLIASLIKSPIPFVFLIFYGCYIALFRKDLLFSVRRLIIIATPFLLALITAICAEMIRRRILGTDNHGFAQSPSWYFGSLSQRISLEFWARIWERSLDSYSYHTIGWLSVILGIGYLISGKNNIKTGIPFIIAFFSGWLVFSNVYFIHDYYDMPSFLFLYIFIAVAGVAALKWGVDAVSSTGSWLSASAIDLQNYLLAATACVLVIYMPHISALKSDSFYGTLAYALRNANHFFYADNNFDGNPEIGGYAKTNFTHITIGELNTECDKIVYSSKAILVKGWSSCLATHKNEAKAYLEETVPRGSTNAISGKYQLLVTKHASRPIVIGKPTSKPIPPAKMKIDDPASAYNGLPTSPFEIYYNNNTITYSKNACSNDDVKHTFFLHIFYGKIRKFKNLDFNYQEHGYRTKNNICIIRRRIQGMPTRIETGQYSAPAGKSGQPVCCVNYWAARIDLNDDER